MQVPVVRVLERIVSMLPAQPTAIDVMKAASSCYPIRWVPTDHDAAMLASGDDGPSDAVIAINFSLQPPRLLESALHELAEYLLIVDVPGFWDGCCVQMAADERHAAAVEIASELTARYMPQPKTHDFLPVLAIAWRRDHPPVPELEHIIKDDFAF
jgi:hypothetical protein